LFELGDQILSRMGVDASSDALSPVMVEYYRRVGFLPEGVLNSLVRLGWSLDDHTEFLSLNEMLQGFSLDRIIKSAAGLDPDKLMSFQSHWMNQLAAEEKLNGCLQFLQQAQLIDDSDDAATRQFVTRVIELAADRLRVFGDIYQLDEFFKGDRELSYDEKNFQKRVVKPEAALDLLRELRRELVEIADFTAEPLHQLVQTFVTARGIKAGDLFPALRLCVTGKAQGADLFATLELLGRSRVVARMDHSIGLAESRRSE
jgi:glutamyl-tRNA synthetase